MLGHGPLGTVDGRRMSLSIRHFSSFGIPRRKWTRNKGNVAVRGPGSLAFDACSSPRSKERYESGGRQEKRERTRNVI